MAHASSEKQVREKYLEYCAALVVGRMDGMSPTEWNARHAAAEKELSEGAQGPASQVELGPILSSLPAGSMGAITARVLEHLFLECAPPLAAWEQQYRADPARFDRDLVGLRAASGRAADSTA